MTDTGMKLRQFAASLNAITADTARGAWHKDQDGTIDWNAPDEIEPYDFAGNTKFVHAARAAKAKKSRQRALRAENAKRDPSAWAPKMHQSNLERKTEDGSETEKCETRPVPATVRRRRIQG